MYRNKASYSLDMHDELVEACQSAKDLAANLNAMARTAHAHSLSSPAAEEKESVYDICVKWLDEEIGVIVREIRSCRSNELCPEYTEALQHLAKCGEMLGEHYVMGKRPDYTQLSDYLKLAAYAVKEASEDILNILEVHDAFESLLTISVRCI